MTKISERAEGLDRKLARIYSRSYLRGSWTPDARDAIQAALDAERQEARAKALAEMAAVIEAMRWKGSE